MGIKTAGASTPKKRRRVQLLWGEGSVYQRKSDMRWCGGTKVDGKPRVVYAPPDDNTAAAAERKLRELRRDAEDHIRVDARTITLGQYLKDWLSDQRDNVEPTTYRSYQTVIEARLAEHAKELLAKRLKDVEPEEVEDALNALGKRYARSTLRLTKSVLGNALNDAVRLRKIRYSPVSVVKLRRKVGRQTAEKQVLTAEESMRLLAVARGHQYEAAIAVLLDAAPRFAELGGLEWRDVDWARGSITLRQTLQRVGKDWLVCPTKTKTVHTVLLQPATMEALRRHELRQKKQRLRAEHDWPCPALVFTTSHGQPLHNSTFRRAVWAPLPKDAGINKHVTPHGCRHSLTSQAAAVAGQAGNVQVSRRLGHKHLQTTTGSYLKPFEDEASLEAERRLISALRAPGPSPHVVHE